MSEESRPRRSGKVYEASLIIRSRCGLPVDVISGLIRAGWTYSERMGEPHRWESPVAALQVVKGCNRDREVLIKAIGEETGESA